MSGDETIHFVDAILMSLTREAEEAKQRFELLRRMPRCIPAECRAVWHDAAFSFVFGRYCAALSTCGVFVECFLRKAIPAFIEVTGRPPEDLPENLSGLIKLAKKINLITSDEASLLDDFRKFVRNPFAHGNVDAVCDSLFRVQKVTEFKIKEGKATWQAFTLDEIKTIADKTVSARLEMATKEFATPVMAWVSNWSASCALNVWKGKIQP